MIEIKEILLRITSKSSIRNISDSLGIHRETIKNYVELTRKFGFDAYKDSKDVITDELIENIKSCANVSKNKYLIPRNELLLPHIDKIEQYLKSAIKGSKIIVLLARSGIVVTKPSFYRFLRNSCESYARKNITVRLPETDPGVYCQADFGRLGKIWDKAANKLRVAWALVITLCYSRHMFIYVTFKQDMVAVIAGFEAAWSYFGGITQLVIVDNLKTVVDKSDRCDPRINKTFLEYAQYRGFTLDPANAGHPRGKAADENMVGNVSRRILAPLRNRQFFSIYDINCAIEMELTKFIHRPFQKMEGNRTAAFERIDKPLLIPLPATRYEYCDWKETGVAFNYHAEYEGFYYSVDHSYAGHPCSVRATSKVVEVFVNNQRVAAHLRNYNKFNHYVTTAEHMPEDHKVMSGWY